MMAPSNMLPWIEQDALQSLQQQQDQQEPSDSYHQIDSRIAHVCSLGSGWTEFGINLSCFGRLTSAPYPSIVISDGRFEIVAYLVSEAAQSSAYYTIQTAMTTGTRIRIKKARFVPASSLDGGLSNNNQNDGDDTTTFALALYGAIQVEHPPPPPVVNLNQSPIFREAVRQWMGKKKTTDGGGDGDDADSGGGVSMATDTREIGSENNDDADVVDSRNGEEEENGNEEEREEKSLAALPGEKKKQKKRTRKNLRTTWEEKMAYLRAYKEEFGHCNCPPKYKIGEFAVGTFVNQLRTGKDKLSEDQRRDLDEIGFIYNLAEHNWLRNFEAVRQFQEENGGAGLSKEQLGTKLGTWLYNQRQAYRKGKMKPWRAEKLESLGLLDLGNGDPPASDNTPSEAAAKKRKRW